MKRPIATHLAAKAAVGVILSSLVLAGCRKPVQVPQFPPAEVSVATPLPKRLMEWDEYIGRLEAVESVEVRSRVSGYLMSSHFQEGREVKKGDLLFVIDPSTYEADAARTSADVARAEAALALAVSEANRAQNLVASKVVSTEEYDTKVQTRAQAAAALQSAKASDLGAKLQLGFTRISAPISGRIGRKLVTEGNLITGGPANATLLTTIVSVDPIYAYTDVDETAALRYRRLAAEGKRASAVDTVIPAELALPDDFGWPHKGGVDFVDNRVDPSTGTIRGRAVFPNAQRILGPGFFARVRIPGSGEYDALLVREHAILSDQAMKLVMVVGPNNIPEPRPVKIGPMVDGLRVIREGIQAGDRIIVEGLAKVRPGVPVKPADEPMQPAAPVIPKK